MESVLRKRAGLLVLLMIFCAQQVLAEGCERCRTYSEQHTGQVATWCEEVDSFTSGNTKCGVECFYDDDFAFCVCTEEGDFCYSIVVEG